jgi:hypothetical protein
LAPASQRSSLESGSEALAFCCLRIGRDRGCDPAEGQNGGWQAQHDRLADADVTEGGGDSGRQPGGDAHTGKAQRSPCSPCFTTLPVGMWRGFGLHVHDRHFAVDRNAELRNGDMQQCVI